MYRMQNGILYHHGEPVIGMGQSYYPSYHEQKVPVPPDGDRVGEMQGDMRHMRDVGFNIVRMAALGDVRWNDGDVQVDFPLPDAFCDTCETMDMAAMIRLQGYSMNLRGFDDATMLDQHGEPMRFHWGWFVRNCLNHPGIYEDNVRGTVASAAHFGAFPSVVSFQIYNEPAYPSEGFYDYHPHSIAAYQNWLVEKGYASRAEADAIDPPRSRPLPGEDATPWIRFRAFSTERMTDYLVQMGLRAHEGYAAPETLTCHMACPVMPGAAIRGEQYFETAKGMDVLGITHYTPCRGPSYHTACLVLDAAESAAATFGKHAWIIEYNARTNMPPREWDRETYAALGRGYKGILYYEWRADYPYADGPEPEGFGMLFNDGRKSSCYDAGVAMIAVVNRLTGWLARAEKARDGLAILHSNHANAHFDAIDNGDAQSVANARDRYALEAGRCYAALNACGAVVDFARAEDLETSLCGIRTLVLPDLDGLSEDERARIDAFARTGNRVFLYQDKETAFIPYVPNAKPVMHGILTEQYNAETLLTVLNITPHARVMNAPACDARLLTGERDGKPFGIVSIANYDTLERDIAGATLCVNGFSFTRATAHAPDLNEAGVPLDVDGESIRLPKLSTGTFILLQ